MPSFSIFWARGLLDSFPSFVVLFSILAQPTLGQNVTVPLESDLVRMVAGWDTNTGPAPVGTYAYTVKPGAFLEFTFTGTAVYLLSPLSPENDAGGMVSVDTSTPVPVEMQSHTSYWINNQVIWGTSGLNGSEIHVLKLTLAGPYDHMRVGTFMYTASPASPEPSDTVTSPAFPEPSDTVTIQVPKTSSNILPAILGGLFGGLIFLGVIVAALWFYLRRNRRQRLNSEIAIFSIDHDSPTPPSPPPLYQATMTKSGSVIGPGPFWANGYPGLRVVNKDETRLSFLSRASTHRTASSAQSLSSGSGSSEAASPIAPQFPPGLDTPLSTQANLSQSLTVPPKAAGVLSAASISSNTLPHELGTTPSLESYTTLSVTPASPTTLVSAEAPSSLPVLAPIARMSGFQAFSPGAGQVDATHFW